MQTLAWALDSFNAVMRWWLQAPGWQAFALSVAVQLAIYLTAASIGWGLTRRVWPQMGLGGEIDTQAPRPGQLRSEVLHGMQACVVLAVASLLYRWQCDGLWPASWAQAAWQLAAFVVFNNIYSYATHRLLHTRLLMRYHRVHHRSVRVTPFSSYSVHLVEATVIGATLPIFMLLVPLSLSAAIVLHLIGMVYTTCIHSNYDFAPRVPDAHWLKKLINHPTYHRHHHTMGRVNYGFTNRLMDVLFRTNHG
jgi:sterol desaturase/sphingolipid hydroxylase (fatty acid hydroxylase superfamily)